MVFTALREPRLPPKAANHRGTGKFFEIPAVWLE
jgi:hypothetical protein